MMSFRLFLGRRNRPAWAVLLICLLLTALALYGLDRQHERSASADFELRVGDVIHSIQARMRQHEQILLGGAGIFDATDSVTRMAWHDYVERLNLKKNYPGIQGVGFSQAIAATDLNAHIALMRRAGWPDYVVRPDGARRLYTSIIFLEPATDRNAAAFGFDMMSEPTRAAAMQAAVDNNVTTISGKVKLVQEIHGKVQAGFLMYVPVYVRNQPLATKEQRWEALRGFVYSPYRVDDLMANILDGRELKLGFEIYNGAVVAETEKMFASDNDAPPRPQSERNSTVRTVDVYGQQWTVRLFNLDQSGPGGAMKAVIAGMGSAIGALFFFLTSFLVVRRDQSELIAAAMTKDIRINQQQLKQSESRLAAVLENVLDGIITISETGHIETFNMSAETIFGYTAAEVIGRKINMLMPEPYQSRHDAYMRNFSETDVKKIIGIGRLVKGRRKDGSIFDMDLAVSQIVLEEKSVYAGVVHDISERKRLEDARNESLNLIRQISNRVPGMVYQYLMRPDGSSCFPYSSAAISEIYRVAPEDVREDASSVFAILHPDDYAGIVASIQKSAAELTPWIYEYRVQFADGAVNWLLANAMPERLNDGSILWYGFITNINERKQTEKVILESELRLKIILDTCPTAARIIKRGQIKFSYFNSQYLTMTNNSPQTVNDYEPSSYYESKTYAEIMELLGRGENIIDKLVELRKPGDPDFGVKWVLASYFNIIYEDQPATLAWFHEITERIRLEKLKSEFISTVSHELRTPLTSISGSLGLVVNEVFGKIPAQANQMIEVAHRNSLRLTYMINDLLDMDKLVSGKLIFYMQEHLLVPLIRRSIEDNSSYQRERQVKLVFMAVPELDHIKVVCDEQRLLQVLSNLLSNAIKFSPDSGQVLIELTWTGQHRDQLKISVTDQGPGIPVEFHQRIFQKFSQADSSDIRQKGGTGLGLAISRALIEQMGGEIGFTSVAAQGSCFFIILAMKPSDGALGAATEFPGR